MVQLFCNVTSLECCGKNLFDYKEDILPFLIIMFNICKDKCINKITILAKYYIYASRCKGKYITYNAFVSYLKQNYYIEMRTARQVYNHNNIWSNILHRF